LISPQDPPELCLGRFLSWSIPKGSDLLSRLQVVILIVIPFRRIIGSLHLFGDASVIWGADGVARDPPGAHHLGLQALKLT